MADLQVRPIDRGSRTRERAGFVGKAAEAEVWRWTAWLGLIACPFCWAMHGTLHPVEEEMITHERCRCRRVPVLPDDPPLAAGQSGPELFAGLPFFLQILILGWKTYELYANSTIRLQDVVGFREDGKEWTGYVRSAGQIKREPNPHLPQRPLRAPGDRHLIAKVGLKSKVQKRNTVIESWVDVRGDIEAINRGDAIRRGNLFLINGRLYLLKGTSDRVIPVAGPGFHSLGRQVYSGLMAYNAHGVTPAAEKQLDDWRVSPADRLMARRALGLEERSHDGGQ